MKNLLDKKALIVFILFYGLYGYAISFELTTADSYRIGARFCQSNFSWWLVWRMYQEGALTDVYLNFVFGILKPFTDNPKVLYGILGLVMGVFAGLSIRQLYTIWKGKRDNYFYLFVFLYFLILSFFNLQTTRFFTATSIFSYFVIQYMHFGQKKAILGVLVTPLFHFSYIAPVFALFVYIYGVKWFSSSKLCYWIMAVSFAMFMAMPQSSIDDMMEDGEEVGSLIGSNAINKKFNSYSNSTKVPGISYHEEVSAYRQANSAFKKATQMIHNIGMFLLITALYRKRKQFIKTAKQKKFFNYVMYAYAVAYLASLFFSSGHRFTRLACLLFLFCFLTIFQNSNNIITRQYCKLLIPINFYSISFFFFNVTRMVTPLFWFVPPIFTIIDGIGFGAIDFV